MTSAPSSNALKNVAARLLSWKFLRAAAFAYGAAMLAVWLVLLLGYATGRGARDNTGEILGPDFPSFYTGGWMLNHGEKARLYDTLRQRDIQRELGLRPAPPNENGVSAFVHPPHYALLVSPLSRLPYRAAFLLNTFFTFGCVALALWILREKLPPDLALPTLKTRAGTLLILLALFSSPVYFFVSAGQSSGLFLLLHTAILVSLSRRRDLSAGFFIAAGMLKPHLFLALIPLLALRRKWRVLAAAFAGIAMIAMLTFAVFGPQIVRQELRLLSSSLYQGEEARQAFQMFSWMPFWKLLLGFNGFDSALGALSMLAIFGFLCVLWLPQKAREYSRDAPAQDASARNESASRDDLPLRYAITVCGLCMMNPHLPVYDLSLLILPALIFADRVVREPLSRFTALRLSLLALVFFSIFNDQARQTHLQIVVPLTTALMFLALPLYRQSSREVETRASTRAPELL